ncbi:MAG: hypothetical protein IJ899_19830 [Blautia sp.]|nr:hypothetical protein [Blautia sp.]
MYPFNKIFRHPKTLSQHTKLRYGTKMLSLSLLLCLGLPWICQDAQGAALEAGCICGDDELMVLMDGLDHGVIYDKHLNYVMDGSITYFSQLPAGVISKDNLVLSSHDGYTYIVDLRTMEEIKGYDNRYFRLSHSEDYIGIYNLKKHTARLVDRNGKVLAKLKLHDTEEDYDWTGHMHILSKGKYIGFFVSDSGSLRGVIRDKASEKEWNFEGLGGYPTFIGDYFFFSYTAGGTLQGKTLESNTVYDMDGNRKLENVLRSFDDPANKSMENRLYNEYSYKNYIVAESEEGYVLYDETLKQVCVLPDSLYPDEMSVNSLEIYGGWIRGMAYPELGNRICDGFLLFEGQESIPYAHEENDWYFWVDDRLETIKLEEGFAPKELNEKLLIARKKNEKNGGTQAPEWRIYRREDHTCILSSPPGSTNNFLRYELIKDGILCGNGGSYIIYDENGLQTYATDKMVYQISPGLCYHKRGIYTGFIDLYGNWIAKTISSGLDGM